MSDDSLIFFTHQPDSSDAALIYGLDGWTDIGLAASTAISFLRESLGTELIGVFDSDALIDYRARRPVFTIENGVSESLDWPDIEIHFGQLPGGRDVLLIAGPEPDARWREFTREIVGLARRFDVTDAIGVGSFPAPVPHTRPVSLVATSNKADVSAAVGVTPGRIQVPGGAQAAIELALAAAGFRAISLWARIPHYLSGMTWPAGALALIEGIEGVAGVDLDTLKLATSAGEAKDRINELVQSSDETREYVARLESAEAEAEADQITFASVTGDEIAKELEQFLARHDDGDDGN